MADTLKEGVAMHTLQAGGQSAGLHAYRTAQKAAARASTLRLRWRHRRLRNRKIDHAERLVLRATTLELQRRGVETPS